MKIYNKSVEGASHKNTGLPCQDYSISLSFEKGSIIVISDGHGSRTYVRSDIGSKLACEVAVNETTRFVVSNYDLLKEKGKTEISYTPDSEEPQDALFYNLFATVHDKWYDAIRQHKEDNEFTDDEKAKLGDADIKKAYGCTLIVAVKTNDFTFAYQIGDGRLFFIMPDPEKLRWQQPVPWDSRCNDNVTTSLCNVNPIGRFRYYLYSGRNQPFAIFICSDGIEDCFDGEHNANFKSPKLEVDYAMILCKFLKDENFDALCESYLSDESMNGSKDDMSIAFIINDVYNIQEEWIELNRLKKERVYLYLAANYYRNKENEYNKRLGKLGDNITKLQKILDGFSFKEKELKSLESQKIDIDSQPSVCNGFVELINFIIQSIDERCSQYKENAQTPETNKLHIQLRNKLNQAIRDVRNYIEKQLIPEISKNHKKVEKEIEKLETEITNNTSNKTRYNQDLERIKGNLQNVNKEKEQCSIERKKSEDAYSNWPKANAERVTIIKTRINEKLKCRDNAPIDIVETKAENDVCKINIQQLIGRSWNIGKHECEYIVITVFNNNVQFAYTKANITNNHSISLDNFKDLYILIEDAFSRDDAFTIESSDINDGVIETETEEGELIWADSTVEIWNLCMKLINKEEL